MAPQKTKDISPAPAFHKRVDNEELAENLLQKDERLVSQDGEPLENMEILNCGTSIGTNLEEALVAQSKKDFLSKMSIASKEARGQ